MNIRLSLDDDDPGPIGARLIHYEADTLELPRSSILMPAQTVVDLQLGFRVDVVCSLDTARKLRDALIEALTEVPE